MGPPATKFGTAVFKQAAEAKKSVLVTPPATTLRGPTTQKTFCLDCLIGQSKSRRYGSAAVGAEAETLERLEAVCNENFRLNDQQNDTNRALGVEATVESHFFGPLDENGLRVSGMSFTWRVYCTAPGEDPGIDGPRFSKAEDEDEDGPKRIQLCEVSSAILVRELRRDPDAATEASVDGGQSALDTVPSVSSPPPTTQSIGGTTKTEDDTPSRFKRERTETDIDINGIPAASTSSSGSLESDAESSVNAKRIKQEEE